MPRSRPLPARRSPAETHWQTAPLAASILLFIAGELGWRAVDSIGSGGAARRSTGRRYGYDAARANPKAWVDFWDRHREQMKKVPWVMASPRGLNPYVLRPGAKGMLNDSEVRINQLGFRGREISVDKGNRFRIVALGESTTFDVHFIDTAPGLDGEYHELFLDLVHFTQPGRERLAGNILAGIREILLTHPRLHCRPAA